MFVLLRGNLRAFLSDKAAAVFEKLVCLYLAKSNALFLYKKATKINKEQQEQMKKNKDLKGFQLLNYLASSK